MLKYVVDNSVNIGEYQAKYMQRHVHADFQMIFIFSSVVNEAAHMEIGSFVCLKKV
jgi:fibronectin type 3 domain-containing protein